ncbi:hypothetical protein OSU_2685 [Vibrio cholerae PS15]|nr:hypothetical protein OSU_2685 [Vibrio cholerae PS15]
MDDFYDTSYVITIFTHQKAVITHGFFVVFLLAIVIKGE